MKAAACWLGLLLATATAAAAPDAPGQYAATATLAPAGRDGLQRVSLPLAVLQASRSAELADLRVFNAAGEALPFAWAGQPAATRPEPSLQAVPFFAWPGSGAPATGSTPAALPELAIELRTDGAVLHIERRGSTAPSPPAAPRAWLVDLQALAGKSPAALVAQWRGEPQGFVRRARVEASVDAQQWQAVGEASLVDVPGPDGSAALTQRRIALDRVTREQRYLRLWLDAPIALSELRVETGAPPVATPMEHARFALRADGERAWVLDTGGALPVRQLQLHLPQTNSVAPVQVAVRRPDARGRDADAWVAVTSHTAYRLVRDGIEVESPSLELPPTSARHWRITLDARAAGLGQGAPELTLAWVAPQLVFAARGDGPYRLAVGRDNAARAALDRATLIPGYREGDEFTWAAATLGPLQTQAVVPTGATDRLAHASKEELQRWLLWAVLSASVLGLAFLAWRLAHEMRQQPQPKGD